MRPLTLRIAALTVVALAAAGVSNAATGWRVFATATDSGDYYSAASADATVQKPHGLAIRATGDSLEVTWYINCEGIAHPAAGKTLLITVAAASKCSLNGHASSEKGGPVRVQLLRR